MRTHWIGKLGLVALLVATTIAACGSPPGPRITAEDVWSRPAIAQSDGGESTEGDGEMGQGMGGTGAVFMRLVNEGQEADRLIGAETEVAKVVEIHETTMEGDVMKMRMLPNGLEVPAKGEVLLKPGGYHMMLIGLQRDLEEGDRFAIEMQFEKGPSLVAEPEVRQP